MIVPSVKYFSGLSAYSDDMISEKIVSVGLNLRGFFLSLRSEIRLTFSLASRFSICC